MALRMTIVVIYIVMPNLKKDYEKYREDKNNRDSNCRLPGFIEDGLEACKSLCKSRKSKLKGEELATENSKMVTIHKISLSGQSAIELSSTQEKTMPEKEDQRGISNSIAYQSVNTIGINNGNNVPYIVVPFILTLTMLGISYKANNYIFLLFLC
ncbi:hypothetical protein PCHDS_000490800 [Plasmodium chabaudi adami]|uniref:Uncharacterized protein n=1 Tax=Plasmodium chabaudi adami TaxID=5826 RepID=A0A1C6W9G6_PLACE|nr:hypothetical protein PCHDS_000490800 [Plasmodium chabaudi adami]